MPGIVPSTMLGMGPVPGMMQPRADASLPPSARLAAKNERLERRSSGQLGEAAGGGLFPHDPISAASYIHSWSPIPSAPMSPSRNSVSEGSHVGENQITSAAFGQFMMSNAGGNAAGNVHAGNNGHASVASSGSSHIAGLRAFDAAASPRSQLAAASDGTIDRRSDIHPASFGDARGIMPLYTDDPGSVQHQLEDLSWTDYFSRFLDDIGGGSASMASASSTGSVAAPPHGTQQQQQQQQAQMARFLDINDAETVASNAYVELPFAIASSASPANYAQDLTQSPHRAL